MKRFLWVDESGRGFSAEWTSREIADDIRDNGPNGFAEYDNAAECEECDTERLSEWLARCDIGDEFDLDAARLVCIADDYETDDAPTFNVETVDGGATLLVRDETGAVVATLERAPQPPTSSSVERQQRDERWAAIVRLVSGVLDD